MQVVFWRGRHKLIQHAEASTLTSNVVQVPFHTAKVHEIKEPLIQQSILDIGNDAIGSVRTTSDPTLCVDKARCWRWIYRW